MLLLSLLLALVTEHFRPVTHKLPAYFQFSRYARWVERHVNAGLYHHGVLAWLAALLPIVFMVGVIDYVLSELHPLLGMAWKIAVLYLTMGFKHFSDSAREVAGALRGNNIELARKLIARWHNRPTEQLNADEIARLSIERTFIYAHRHLFGIIAWFLLLGAAGAVLYRLAHVLYQLWSTLEESNHGVFGRFAVRAFAWMDWLPARLTAASFAIVGNFEDAVYCWRYQASTWSQIRLGLLLASGAGALGVRLGESLTYLGGAEQRPQLGLGEEADADFLEGAVSLIWRALLLWLAILFLIYLGYWLGQA